ncbi:MAG: acyl carrier protein [Muribaculaceae bacterium]|nr:acyl carrier protein [Muribaculaceae bacterium]MDE6332976.1 acyl carrier protein [Muribaculaceae bacterium]
MDNNTIIAKLQEIFRDVLDNDDIILDRNTSAADIDEWDSLANVQLIIEIESEFGIRFTSAEIPSWQNIGDITDCIAKKI